MRSHKLQQGVTWKEVLGVAVIILLVFVTLFGNPFRSVRRENARRTACSSNLKQIGLAYMQYAQDNDNSFPSGRSPGGQGWAGQIYRYIPTIGVYQCPDDTESAPYISYAENLRLVHRKIIDIADPALTVANYEDTTLDCDPSTAEVVSSTGISAPQDSKRHDDTDFRLNYLFVDGHVKWLKQGAVSSGLNAVRPKQMEGSRNGPGPGGQYAATFAIK